MPEVTITIGGRDFAVACQEGEEHYLQTAAQALDTEASVIAAQGRLPEARMLLMAGLMLADKTAGVEEQLKATTSRVNALESEVSQLRAAPAGQPEKIEVAVIPETVTDALADIATRTEALASAIKEKATG